MNRITIGQRIYDLGKVLSRRMSQAEWTEAKQHLRRDDKAHVVKVGDELFYVIEAKFDPKYSMIDLYYRTMTLSHVMPRKSRDDSDDDAPSIRSIRRGEGEL